MTVDTLADRFRSHYRTRDHLYGALLVAMADDWEAGGVTRAAFAGWEDAEIRQFPQLRLLAGLFRIVLRGDAPQLEPFYPVLGGTGDPADAWPVVEPVLREHLEELRAALAETPQTNEPARTVALLVGLSEAVRRTGLRQVRLLEPGASGGLGLLVDHYRFEGEGWSAGPVDSPLRVTDCGGAGFEPDTFRVVERRGCDVAPVDVTTDEGAAYLRSFVWPWMLERHARLAGAIEVARAHPPRLDRAPASSWVRERLAEPVPDGVLTVVWHSVTRAYWPAEEVEAMEAAIAEARSRVPLAHVAMETPLAAWASVAARDLGTLPRIELDDEVLGTVGHHGPPVTLGDPSGPVG